MILKATLNDIDDILLLINNVILSFKELNIDQWQNGYPNYDIIKNDIELQRAYIYKDKIIIGYFVLQKEIESTYNNIYYGNWLNDKEYYCIHRLAILNDYKRLGVASNIINYCIDLAKLNNKDIRVDTHKDNYLMANLLLKYNFIYCGVIILLDNSSRDAYHLVI